MSTKINLIWNEFVYGGHILAVGGSSVAYTGSLLLGINSSWSFLLMIYFIIQAVYLFDRYLDLKHDSLTNSTRTKYLSKHFQFIPVLILFYILLFLAILFSAENIMAIFFGLGLIGASLLYALIFKNITKKIPAFKNIFVSLCWASIVVLLNLYYNYPINIELILVFSFVFIILFANVSFCDIKDYEGDKKKKILTPAVIFGKEKLISILRIIIPISFLPLIYGVYYNVLPGYTLFLLFMVPYIFHYLNRAEDESSDLNYTTNTLVYGGYILWGVFTFIGKLIMNYV